MTMIIQRLLRGVSPVLEVPFHDDESVDYDGFSEVVAHSLGTGVTSVMFPGFASEFHKLAADERQLLRGRLLDQTRSRNDVAAIVAVQDHATIVAVRRAVEAVADGADAINLLPPYLLGPSRSAVRAHVRAVLLAVAPTPVVLQYAPAQTGTSLDAETIASIAADHTNPRGTHQLLVLQLRPATPQHRPIHPPTPRPHRPRRHPHPDRQTRQMGEKMEQLTTPTILARS